MTDEKSPMADQVSTRDPNAPKLAANPMTEAEHAFFYAGFSRGYEEGCNFALAKGHQWAIEKLASVKAEVDRAMTDDKMRIALEWALDEIDVLSNRLVKWAYPQGMAMIGREDQFEKYKDARAALSTKQEGEETAITDLREESLRQGVIKRKGEEVPIPSPTGTELALEQAKKHIARLTSFWMESEAFVKACRDGRAFIAGVPEQEGALDELNTISAAMAEDEGLWFIPVTITEDYLQRALRKLCAAIESRALPLCAPDGSSEWSRPATSNADEWQLWLQEHADSDDAYKAVQIVEAIEEHQRALAREVYWLAENTAARFSDLASEESAQGHYYRGSIHEAKSIARGISAIMPYSRDPAALKVEEGGT